MRSRFCPRRAAESGPGFERRTATTSVISVIDVAAGLVFRAGRLLITQRPPGTHLAGLWEFPGGKLQAGESWEGALVRELREEIDFEVIPGRLYEEVVHAYPEKTVRLRFYRCRAGAGEPRAVECAALAWISKEELSAYAFPAADARLLERLTEDDAVWA